MAFVELSDGTLINPVGILRLQPASRGNRLDYVDGQHITLGDVDAEMIRQAVRAKKPGRKPKSNLNGGAMD